jgi:hypothetical protein
MLSDNEKGFLKEGLAAGIPEETLANTIRERRAKRQPAAVSEPQSIFTPAEHGTMDAESIERTRNAAKRNAGMIPPETWGEVRTQAEPAGRPAIEGLGQFLGELGGGAAGSALMPGVGTVAGVMAGGAGGYAGGSQLADLIFGTDKSNLGMDALIGGATSGLGQAIGPAAKWAVGHIPTSALRAGKQLADAAEGLGSNFIGKADDLISKIPGFEPMLGQAGEEGANLTGLARKVLNSGDEKLIKRYNDRLLDQNNAMKSYLKDKIPAGDVDDLISAANEVRDSVAKGIEIPQEQLSKLADSISSVDTPDAYSGEIRELLREAQDNIHGIVSKKWDDLPNYPVGVNSVKRGIADLRKELELDAMVEDLPEEVMKAIDNTPMSKDVPLAQIRRWISTAGKKAYAAPRGSTEKKAAKALQQKLVEILDNQLGGMADYNSARKAWKGYKDRFYDGAVGKALDTRKDLSDLKAIRGMYNPADPQKSDAIIKALGQEQGREAISNIALSELRDKAYLDGTGVIDPKRATKWIENNRNLLKRYGLEDKFSDFEKVGQRILDAEKNDKNFQKTILSKITNKNPDEIISSLLSSSESGKDTIRLIEEISKETRNPSAAIDGLKAAFKEHALTNAANKEGLLEGGALRDVLKKYEPVMKQLYNNQNDLKSLYDIRKLLSFTEELYPKGSMPGSNLPTKFAYGVNVPGTGGSAMGPVEIFKNWYEGIGKGRLEEALFDPKLAKRLMERLKTARNTAGNIAGSGAAYSTPIGGLVNSLKE